MKILYFEGTNFPGYFGNLNATENIYSLSSPTQNLEIQGFNYPDFLEKCKVSWPQK